MSATNHTTNYELPIFIGTDKPAWLVDWNGAMTAIDTAIHTAEGKADQAGVDIGGIETSISTINSTISSINDAVSQLRIDTNANTGNINTINSLIGNGEPTTTDKTIIGAINEINATPIKFGTSENLNISFNAPVCSEVYSGFSEVKFMKSANNNYGKVYGGSEIKIANNVDIGNKNLLFTLSSTDSNIPAPTQAYEIFLGMSVIRYTTSAGADVQVAGVNTWMRFTTTGTIEVYAQFGESAVTSASYEVFMFISLPPCIYLLGDLGD